MNAISPSLRARRAAVAVPDAGIASVIARHLRRRGFDVVELDTAEGVMRACEPDRAASFALLLTDLYLNDGSGVDLTRTFTSRFPNGSVVLLAPGDEEAQAREAVESGAVGFLLRPFSLFELDAVIGRALARLEAEEASSQAAEGGDGLIDYELIPSSWLHWGDDRSGAGDGHGYRVARAAKLIASAIPNSLSAEERWTLEFAARAHELGWLAGPAPSRIDMAVRSAEMLGSLGVDAAVVRLVRHMFEHWDGSGGPDGLEEGDLPLTALALSAADRIDHFAVAHASASALPEVAAVAAVQGVLQQPSGVLGPVVIEAVARMRPQIESIWTISAAWPEH